VPEPDDSGFSLKPLKSGNYQLPPVSLLERNSQGDVEIDRKHYYKVSNILVAKLRDFGVKGTVEGVSPGPVVTTYEFAPAAGVKINKIVSLADDLAMVLKVDRVRIVGSIPGKAALGIEIPNPVRRTVFLRDILMGDAYRESASYLTLALGFDVIGRPIVADLSRMPHLLIAGATGAGKSVAINAFISSILFKATPDEVRLLLIDPKRIELSVYEGIPHLLHPVVVEPKMASRALIWAVREMERRYRLLEEMRVKSFISYNEVAEEKLPYIVIIVDELADLMMVASKDVETSIARLAQMARAAGMHIMLATQRPSVDVLTGLIKANFPTRISFKVASKVDSRTILDGSGAEHLLGLGDMLFLPPGAAKLQRIHGAFITEEETERIIAFLKEQGSAQYDESVLQEVEEEPGAEGGEAVEYDEKYDQAVAIVTETGQASISMVQRRLRVGYNRAARMIEMMEREGIVGPADGSRPREVLARRNYS
jgi:S-DNA-T family DNA segregation ATPase FtsK/SpoIIIE